MWMRLKKDIDTDTRFEIVTVVVVAVVDMSRLWWWLLSYTYHQLLHTSFASVVHCMNVSCIIVLLSCFCTGSCSSVLLSRYCTGSCSSADSTCRNPTSVVVLSHDSLLLTCG